jgi:hypothetical protein
MLSVGIKACKLYLEDPHVGQKAGSCLTQQDTAWHKATLHASMASKLFRIQRKIAQWLTEIIVHTDQCTHSV